MKLYHKLFNCTSLTPKTYYFGMVSNGKKKKRKPYKTKNITHSIAKGYIEDFTQIRTQQNLEGNYKKKSTNQQQKNPSEKKKKLIIVIIREEKQIALYLTPVYSLKPRKSEQCNEMMNQTYCLSPLQI